jgi:hypothetical protein
LRYPKDVLAELTIRLHCEVDGKRSSPCCAVKRGSAHKSRGYVERRQQEWNLKMKLSPMLAALLIFAAPSVAGAATPDYRIVTKNEAFACTLEVFLEFKKMADESGHNFAWSVPGYVMMAVRRGLCERLTLGKRIEVLPWLDIPLFKIMDGNKVLYMLPGHLSENTK